jgi:hypothetical protein
LVGDEKQTPLTQRAREITPAGPTGTQEAQGSGPEVIDADFTPLPVEPDRPQL